VNGALNIWRTLGILSDEPPAPTTPPRLLTRNEWLRSEHEGIFDCRVQPGERVAQGQLLGEMVDLLGEHLADILSPARGIILFTVTSPAIKRGGLLLAVGVPED
jgi:predicted deacylase